MATENEDDDDEAHSLRLGCPGMGLNDLDDSREGIRKVNLVVFSTKGNAFWEALGFTTRPDLIYRNRTLTETTRAVRNESGDLGEYHGNPRF